MMNPTSSSDNLNNSYGTSGLFNDLIYKIHEGHVFISRRGAMVQDIVTENLTGPLEYFGWQLNKPIDYHTLKIIILASNICSQLAIRFNNFSE